MEAAYEPRFRQDLRTARAKLLHSTLREYSLHHSYGFSGPYICVLSQLLFTGD